MDNQDSYKIFVVEDDDWYGEMLVYNLTLNPDFEVKRFTSGKEMLNALHERPQVVTLDYRLPGEDGEKLLKEIKDFDPQIGVVIISEQESIETAVKLLKEGASDYIVKSEQIQDRLHSVINHLRKQAKLQEEITHLRREVGKKYDFQTAIIGDSPPMVKVFNLMEKTVDTNISVVVTGETGTGKEVVAKAIHYNSRRADKPFVPVNMAAIPQELVESELFGHEKGAFTGAHARRKGKFEAANGGTLFLDEIGEMDLTLQAKLLRALQEKEITPVGGNNTLKVDVRIIVATNRDLLEEVREGNFRKDLYYRLFGVTIELPPLRERGKDMITLSNYFASEFTKANDMPPIQISSAARKKLMSYHWPGNIRELKSVIELGCVMSNNGEITPDDLQFGHEDDVPELFVEGYTLRDYTHRIIRNYLDKYDHNVRLVSEKLDIGQSTLYRMIKENQELQKDLRMEPGASQS